MAFFIPILIWLFLGLEEDIVTKPIKKSTIDQTKSQTKRQG